MRAKRAPTEPRTIDDFIKEILVTCPTCSNQAAVKSNGGFGLARLTCKACSLAMSKDVRGYSLGSTVDPYFGLPLWLQAPCSPHTLWAYNPDHLSFLKQYVEATDRRRPIRNTTDPLNGLLASRLPKWMQLSKNRDRILKVIRTIETKLAMPANKGNANDGAKYASRLMPKAVRPL